VIFLRRTHFCANFSHTMLSILLQIEEFTVYFSYFVADISVHTLRAEPLLSLFWRDRKRGSAQICFIVWSPRRPKSWASHSGLRLSNWFYKCEHQLLREADGRNWAQGIQRKHGGEALAKGGPSKMLDLLARILSSLSPLEQILSCPCPQSLITENFSFYKVINVRWRSQKSCK